MLNHWEQQFVSRKTNYCAEFMFLKNWQLLAYNFVKFFQTDRFQPILVENMDQKRVRVELIILKFTIIVSCWLYQLLICSGELRPSCWENQLINISRFLSISINYFSLMTISNNIPDLETVRLKDSDKLYDVHILIRRQSLLIIWYGNLPINFIFKG